MLNSLHLSFAFASSGEVTVGGGGAAVATVLVLLQAATAPVATPGTPLLRCCGCLRPMKLSRADRNSPAVVVRCCFAGSPPAAAVSGKLAGDEGVEGDDASDKDPEEGEPAGGVVWG